MSSFSLLKRKIKHVKKITLGQHTLFLLFVVIILLVGLFVTISITKENQDRRSRADTIITVPGTYGYGGYGDSLYGGVPTPTPLAQNATIKAFPATNTVATGSSFTVDVVVDGGGIPFNAAQATAVASSNLSITTLAAPSTNACNFTYTQTPTKTDPSFAGAIPGGSSTNCKVYTLTLTMASTGTGTLTFSNGSIKAYSNNGEIFSSATNGTYTFVASTATPTPSSSEAGSGPTAAPIPTNTPTATPAPTAIPTQTPTALPTNTPVPTLATGVTPILTPPTLSTTLTKSYKSTAVLSGKKQAAIARMFINGSTASIAYPSTTDWQAIVNLNIGTNNFIFYGEDTTGNISNQVTITMRRNKLSDINGDGIIDLTDISLFAVDWQKTSNFNDQLSDMNEDSIIDLTDFSILAKQYGQ